MENNSPVNTHESPDVRFAPALLMSAAIHLIVIAATSFGLYADWMQWGFASERGFHTPAVIKELRKEAERAAKDAEEKKAAEAAARKQAAAAPVEAAPAPATPAPAAPAASAPAQPAPKAPLDDQVAPPPRRFELDSIDL